MSIVAVVFIVFSFCSVKSVGSEAVKPWDKATYLRVCEYCKALVTAFDEYGLRPQYITQDPTSEDAKAKVQALANVFQEFCPRMTPDSIDAKFCQRLAEKIDEKIDRRNTFCKACIEHQFWKKLRDIDPCLKAQFCKEENPSR
ncbi:hypothetical protein DdX_11811 [Ditylenchus destructor]|uniref:Saposin B-type domain-containing protein n=1 Tax=Ditylenchus destructor TaxID=166010 RepID=A0AAD4R0V6_9BILA|nr:hypothetical protein DdX_11811 [Ditylenchus destructor]